MAATIPGFLVTIHHVVQLARPRIGYGSDVGGKRTPWIIGGMLILGLGGVLAALGTTLIPTQYWLGMATSALGFFAIGVGTGATGTSLLALLAKHVAPERKPAAAALVWFMMIIGFAVTAGVAGHFLDPYSPERLMTVTATVSVLAIVVTLLVIRGIEPSAHSDEASGVRHTLTRERRLQHRPRRGMAGPSGQNLYDLCLRIDARLFGSGFDPRTFRRSSLWANTGGVDSACRGTARRRITGHGRNGDLNATLQIQGCRSVATLDQRWLPALGRRSLPAVLGRTDQHDLVARGQCLFTWEPPTAGSLWRRLAR